ncbi:GntR family transcriptional regulator [Thalassobacillus devorans]|uniref:GntR family transcriptional regulator n=1 Tax=Thalassobacillus devorans TaxID=279813 RepID=UPI000A1CB4A9|nr:GntR family transcriptional regulator [Thalassobacillus devorans]
MEKLIKNYSLSDQIYNLLKESIIKGNLNPGDRILELEVAKKYEVSQAPVREALSRLKKEGFVIHHRNKGSFVSNLSNKNIEEVYSFRAAIEPLAISRAIENITDKQIDKLYEIYEGMLTAGKANNLDEIRSYDVQFHSYIYQLADHHFMYQVWNDLIAIGDRIWYLNTKLYFENLEELAQIHKPIVDSIAERNTEKCISAFKEHMNYVRKKMNIDNTQKK